MSCGQRRWCRPATSDARPPDGYRTNKTRHTTACGGRVNVLACRDHGQDIARPPPRAVKHREASCVSMSGHHDQGRMSRTCGAGNLLVHPPVLVLCPGIPLQPLALRPRSDLGSALPSGFDRSRRAASFFPLLGVARGSPLSYKPFRHSDVASHSEQKLRGSTSPRHRTRRASPIDAAPPVQLRRDRDRSRDCVFIITRLS